MYHFKQLQELHKNTMSPGDAPLPFVGEVPDQVTRTALGVERFPSYTYKKTDLLDGSGFSVMPKLTMRPGIEKLFSATPDQLSNVVPMIYLLVVQVTIQKNLLNFMISLITVVLHV